MARLHSRPFRGNLSTSPDFYADPRRRCGAPCPQGRRATDRPSCGVIPTALHARGGQRVLPQGRKARHTSGSMPMGAEAILAPAPSSPPHRTMCAGGEEWRFPRRGERNPTLHARGRNVEAGMMRTASANFAEQIAGINARPPSPSRSPDIRPDAPPKGIEPGSRMRRSLRRGSPNGSTPAPKSDAEARFEPRATCPSSS